MTMSVAFNAQGLGLGEIQVNSNFGEPLKAQVNLSDLSYADAHDLKARLASIEEYKQIGLQYPAGIRFEFQFVNEQGTQPHIHISTRQSIDEPFLILLMEVSSASGKIIKNYTFLLDPAAGLLSSPVTVQPAANIQQAGTAAAAGAEETKPAIIERSVALGMERSKHKKRKSGSGATALPRSLREGGETLQRKRSSGKFALSLSTSLSISRNAPGQPGEPANRDALQDELIAKEKLVGELNAQIAEMQAVIKLLQLKLGIQAGSAVAGSAVLAQATAASSVPGTAMSGTEAAKPKISDSPATAPVAKPEKKSGSPIWPKVAGIIALLLSGTGAAFWYRKHRLKNEPERASPDDASKPEDAGIPEKSDSADKKTAEQSLKAPGYKSLRTVSLSSPEYDFLEQADIYLRFGHDKLAEDVLREAIKVNPINPHGYLTLLGIYETRGDAAAFYALAQQLKAIGDVADWKKAAEMGRKLDPGNPFYA